MPSAAPFRDHQYVALVGTTDDTIEIVAFAPSMEPAKLVISID